MKNTKVLKLYSFSSFALVLMVLLILLFKAIEASKEEFAPVPMQINKYIHDKKDVDDLFASYYTLSYKVTKWWSFGKRSPVQSVCDLKPLCKRLLCRKILRDNYFFMRGKKPGTMTIDGETNDTAEGYSPCRSISVFVRDGEKGQYSTSKEAFYCPQFLIKVNNELDLSMPFFITPGDKPDSAFVLKTDGMDKRKSSYSVLWFYGSDLKYEEGFKTSCMPEKYQ